MADPLGMDASEMPLTVVFGLVFAVSLILWTEGVRRLRAAEAALLATTETPCSILAAWIVVSEAPPLLTVVGGLLIVGAVVTHARADLARYGVGRPWPRQRTRPKIQPLAPRTNTRRTCWTSRQLRRPLRERRIVAVVVRPNDPDSRWPAPRVSRCMAAATSGGLSDEFSVRRDQ